MFDSVKFATYAPSLAVLTFLISSGVFFYVLYRILRTPKDRIDYVSRLPLNPESSQASQPEEPSQTSESKQHE
ncbi:MAG: hypothetical protein ACFCUX_04450 [Candidatus Methylacidiphilales bacterium]